MIITSAWRGEAREGSYEDVPGFCRSATLDEIAAHNFVLTPGRYVGAGAAEEDGEAFEEKFNRLMGTLREQFAEGRRLDEILLESQHRLYGDE